MCLTGQRDGNWHNGELLHAHLSGQTNPRPGSPVPMPPQLLMRFRPSLAFESWSPLLVPYPFRNCFTVQCNHAGRRSRPQTADRPRSVDKPRVEQGSQGQGHEGRRGGLRWYPECTQEVYPHCPIPTGAKQRSHNLMLITPYTCRVDMQLHIAPGIKKKKTKKIH